MTNEDQHLEADYEDRNVEPEPDYEYLSEPDDAGYGEAVEAMGTEGW